MNSMRQCSAQCTCCIRFLSNPVKTVKTSKLVLAKAVNSNSTHLKEIDHHGNVSWRDVSGKSWEESDVQRYEWTNKDARPVEVNFVKPPPEGANHGHGEESRRLSEALSTYLGNDKALVLSSSKVYSTPPLVWSGTDIISYDGPSSQSPARLHSTTKTEGRKQVHCEESTWTVTPQSSIHNLTLQRPHTPVVISARDNLLPDRCTSHKTIHLRNVDFSVVSNDRKLLRRSMNRELLRKEVFMSVVNVVHDARNGLARCHFDVVGVSSIQHARLTRNTT